MLGGIDYRAFVDIDSTLGSFTGQMNKLYKGQSVKIQPSQSSIQSRKFITERDKLVDPQSDPSIEMVIQNDDKFDAFIASIKSPAKTSAAIFTQDSFVVCIIRPNEAHPVLVMRLPIDGDDVFVKRANLCFDLPLEKLATAKSTGPSSQIKGKALYYKKEESGFSLHYVTSTGKNNKHISSIDTRTFDYLNQLLQTTSLLTFEVQEQEVVDKNLSNLNGINVLLMSKSPAVASFKECEYKKNESLIQIEIDDVQMNMKIYESMTDMSENVLCRARDRDTLIWQPNVLGKYRMLDRTMLLKSNNSNLISSSNYLYYVFGTFGPMYVFMKLVCLREIAIPEDATTYNLLKLIGNNYHIFEMYYCECE